MKTFKLKLFSSSEEKDEKKEKAKPKDGLGKDLLKIGALTGAVYGLDEYGSGLNKYLIKRESDIRKLYDKKEERSLYNKLKKVAKKQKTEITNINKATDNAYFDAPQNKEHALILLKEAKEKYKNEQAYGKRLNERREKENIKKLYYKINHDNKKFSKETINKLKNRLNSIDHIQVEKGYAAALAHELGHSKYYNNRSNGFGEKIHKLSHTINENNIIDPATIGLGFGSGLNSYIKKVQGKKEGKLSKAIPYLTAIGLNAPGLIKEGMASYEGYRKLKDLGASKEFLKNYKKDLGNSLGTHATGILTDIGNALTARQLGKLAGRGIHKIHDYTKKRKNKNKNKEED